MSNFINKVVEYFCSDIPERNSERDMRLQHESPSQEHVGAQGGIQALQADCSVTLEMNCRIACFVGSRED